LSGIYDIAHGAGLSIIFPAWMRYCYRDDIPRFAQFFRRVFGVDYAMDQDERVILEGITHLEAYYRSLGLPVRLGDAQIGVDRLREMAEKCVLHRNGTTGNFKVLDADDIYNIYILASK